YRPIWLAALLLFAVAFAYLLRMVVRPSISNPSDSTPVVSPVTHRSSRLTIKLPWDVQLFLSPDIYKTRSELDVALEHGQGQRYLPSTEQVIVLDSMTFAKGVYGY